MNPSSSLKVFVTGGSGFIGTNLISHFVERGVPVLNVDPSPCTDPRQESLRHGLDILQEELLQKCLEDFDPTHVIHLAAQTGLVAKVASGDYEVNTEGTSRILKAVQASKNVRRIILFSSMLVCPPGYVPKNDQDVRPENEYARSKVELERRVREFALDREWVLVRPTTIWGPWNLRLAKEFYRRVFSGSYLHPYGGPCRRSYGFVGNVVHQVNAMLTAPPEAVNSRTLYVGDPAVDLLEYVDGFSRRLRGKPVRKVPIWTMRPLAWLGDIFPGIPINSYRLSNMTRDNIIDVTEVLRIAGHSPFSLTQGIDATASWLAEHWGRTFDPPRSAG